MIKYLQTNSNKVFTNVTQLYIMWAQQIFYKIGSLTKSSMAFLFNNHNIHRRKVTELQISEARMYVNT